MNVGIQNYIIDVLTFVNAVIVPTLFAFAFLFFLINVARFFIIGANDSDTQEDARTLALYGLLGFVILVSIWGIVNLLAGALGLGNQPLCPDYLDNWCGRSPAYPERDYGGGYRFEDAAGGAWGQGGGSGNRQRDGVSPWGADAPIEL